ncbi:SIS domain-containing protein [Alphaproteobacteria bacterium]|nr:SIS domain-containing protein [Alphaproteobacteria bacterium]
MNSNNLQSLIDLYKQNYAKALTIEVNKKIHILADLLLKVWRNNSNIYIIGNGGSAANANHIANDFTYGAGITSKKGIKIESLASNTAVITCLANDIGYDFIFSEQLKVKATKDDLLIALSGSGNSKNIIEAINVANKIHMSSFAILGFNGGEVKKIVQDCIHFQIHDMQISEDLQMFVFHICSKWLSKIDINK